MSDTFFSTKTCDRCYASLEGKSRKLSWFTEDCLCESCANKEMILRKQLNKEGKNVATLEGCGYLPKVGKK